MRRNGRTLLILIALLAMTAAGSVALDMRAWVGSAAEELKVFQRAVGGLGMGAIAAPIWQFINYDARILSVDDSITWPVPGGYSYGPDRTATVSFFRELPGDQWVFQR